MKFITSERSFTNKLWGIVVYKVLKSDGYSNFLKTVVETLNVCFFVFYFEYHKYIYIYIYNIYNIYYIYIYIYIYICVCVYVCM